MMSLPLLERRKRLEEVLAKLAGDRVAFSRGIVGDGRLYFREVGKASLEGIVAKRLDSPYVVGKRPGSWVKVKHYHTATCRILGYVADGNGGFRSLLLGEDNSGELRHVGGVELGKLQFRVLGQAR